jgi:hypothetical protein
MNNFEKIKNMSIEEVAEYFINEFFIKGFMPDTVSGYKKALIKRLQSEE